MTSRSNLSPFIYKWFLVSFTTIKLFDFYMKFVIYCIISLKLMFDMSRIIHLYYMFAFKAVEIETISYISKRNHKLNIISKFKGCKLHLFCYFLTWKKFTWFFHNLYIFTIYRGTLYHNSTLTHHQTLTQWYMAAIYTNTYTIVL